jgi:hypothetical protein
MAVNTILSLPHFCGRGKASDGLFHKKQGPLCALYLAPTISLPIQGDSKDFQRLSMSMEAKGSASFLGG